MSILTVSSVYREPYSFLSSLTTLSLSSSFPLLWSGESSPHISVTSPTVSVTQSSRDAQAGFRCRWVAVPPVETGHRRPRDMLRHVPSGSHVCSSWCPCRQSESLQADLRRERSSFAGNKHEFITERASMIIFCKIPPNTVRCVPPVQVKSPVCRNII